MAKRNESSGSDARKLIADMADPEDLQAAVHLLNAMKPRPERDAQA